MIRLLAPLILAIGMWASTGELAAEEPAGRMKIAAEHPAARNARVAGDDARTRFVADLSRATEFQVFALADPYRVVIDLPQVDFELPAGTGEQARGLISAFRFGLFGPGKSRIVLDVTGPVAIEKAFALDPVDDQPARLVVELVKSDRESFLRKAAIEAGRRGRPIADKPAAMGRLDGIPNATETLIVLDPGHGGIDPGATSGAGSAEKAIVLEFARTLRTKLQRAGRYRVLMTRDDDVFLPLADRVRFARDRHASLFISIHADATGASEVRGATLYVLSDTATDAEAAALADKENRADAAAGFDMAEENDIITDILLDLTQRETKNLSMMLAKGIVEELKGAARLNKNFLRAAGFRVLRAPDIPSVLVELGYLSSPQDEKLLTSGEWRERTAEAVAKAVESFLGVRTARVPNGGG